MNLPRPQRRAGIALVMVMVMVFVFAGLAAVLSSMMTVETRLARNTSWDTELEWLGRSGIELAKYVLAQPNQSGQPYDANNQIWAGGTAETNDALADISLKDNQLGHGSFSVTITDTDRKFNINRAAASPELLDQGLILMGVDAAEAPHIRNAILDWTDRDDDPRLGSSETESSYYLSLSPPYTAKNGAIDDLTELTMIKGITRNMYLGSGGEGSGRTMIEEQYARSHARLTRRLNRNQGEEPTYALGMRDLFTADGQNMNLNTATVNTLQVIPDVDASLAQAIVTYRAGPDSVEGGLDDTPFRSVGELAAVPGMTPQLAQIISRYVGVRSTTFEVQVVVQIDAVQRTYTAVVRRNGPNQVALLYMYWR